MKIGKQRFRMIIKLKQEERSRRIRIRGNKQKTNNKMAEISPDISH